MNTIVSFPYADGDCREGFKYQGDEKELTAKKYTSLIIKDHTETRTAVNEMIPYLGQNIAINNYVKQRVLCAEVPDSYYTCPCRIFNTDGYDFELAELDELYRKKKPFRVRMYFDVYTIRNNTYFHYDFVRFRQESLNVHKSLRVGLIGEADLFQALPQKDFRIKFLDDNSHALLLGCQLLAQLDSSNAHFLVEVNRIIFLNSNSKNGNQ